MRVDVFGGDGWTRCEPIAREENGAIIDIVFENNFLLVITIGVVLVLSYILPSVFFNLFKSGARTGGRYCRAPCLRRSDLLLSWMTWNIATWARRT